MNVDPADTQWTKSSYSGQGGTCVEWAPAHVSATAVVPVRDSKDPNGPVLHLPARAFASFVTGVKTAGFSAR
ncbi:DUF397 domain-containing protein [Streptomyces sp. NPDC127068]|uniref:DUF397 domain-containing protein n=1 Tax=Streptomyces sp. NPDC127068 TaxID=3347127 RepID=UPI00364AF94B